MKSLQPPTLSASGALDGTPCAGGIMPSQLQSDTARANGAKSNGPATPEGRAISSRNSLRHGLTAKAVVLPGESQEEFQALLDAYIDQFQPATGFKSAHIPIEG